MSSNLGEQSFVPASMVQNILEWQRQALETIREQNKVNQVTQQQNTVLLQRIDTLQQHAQNYKQDKRHLDAMDIDIDTIGTAEEIKGNNQSIPETRGFPSIDTLSIKDGDDLLRQPPDMLLEIERRHKKTLENLDNEWRDKYAQLQTKYDVQYKAYQELKEHYRKRSAEWKRVKKWLDEQKFVQKNPERTDQEWNKDHTDQPNNSDHDMAGLNTEIHNTEKNEKDNHLPSKGNENLGSLKGTTPELAIDLEEGNYEFLFDDPSLKKKRTVDMVNKQENIENDELEVTNKRCKPLTSKPKSKSREEFDEFDETFISDNVITKTPDNNHFKVDSRRPQAPADNMYDDNDIEDANLLTPITPASIKSKGIEKESNNKSNNSKQGEGFRYIETIRKKSEKRQLMAQDCRDCRKYYEMTGISLSRQCDHNQSPETLVQERKQLIGRHRVKYSRPQTPPGFWKVGFPTSQEIAEINELSVAYEREREEQKRKEMEFAKSRERKWDNGTSK